MILSFSGSHAGVASVIVTKIVTGGKKDIREMGSGNAGFTNVLRSVGKVPAIFTIVCDALKCVVAVIIGWLIFSTIPADSQILSNEFGNCGKYIDRKSTRLNSSH